MKTFLPFRLFSLMLAPALVICLVAVTSAGESLEDGFRHPPAQARPWVYWLWLNGYVNRDHVEQELQAFHDAGIRGLCIFDMGARGNRAATPPAGPAMLSDPWLDNLAHVVETADRLGMELELSVASSWDMGGSWVKPPQASMGLYAVEQEVTGPQKLDVRLPLPQLPAAAPRDPSGRPLFLRDVAVLALPADRRLPGFDFVFRLDPPGLHTLDHAVLYNTLSGEEKTYGPMHLFVKEFSIAVSTEGPRDRQFREVFRGRMKPVVGAQTFKLPPIKARWVRLRLLSGHNRRWQRLQLGEFELYNQEGINVVASHAADRSRDGALLVRYSSALGRDHDWTAANIHDGAHAGPGGSWASAGPPPVVIADPAAIVDLTDRLQPDGRLQWQVPPGRWIIERLVCTNTGERLKVPSPNSDGLATDHFSARATRDFLTHLIGRLRDRLGPLDRSPLTHLYLASYEVRGPLWTPAMPELFRRYRHYDLTPYLPALQHHVVVNEQVTERFLYDWRKTLGQVLTDAYYRAAVETAHAAGLRIESEAGGPGPPIHQVPVDALAALGTIDTVRGEFWPKRPRADALWVVKETACAAHIYGKRLVRMEAFTSMHHWQDGPFDLKPAADRAFCEGMNHVVWHTASHLPPEAGKPGWVYYAGTHLNTNIVWWPMAGAFLDYLARCSYLLQQGLFVADVCYYYGDQGFNFVPPKHVDPRLGPGYDYDVTNRDVLLGRMQVHDGKLVLPDGMSYRLLVLPDREDIDVEVLRRIEQLVAAGATVVGPKPVRSTGLEDHQQRDQQVRQLADRLWGPCDGRTVLEHRYGKGRVVWGRSLRQLLAEQGIGPDCVLESPDKQAQFDFIHRRTADADIYFVRNCRPRWQQCRATFRAGNRRPELWDPATGTIRPEHRFALTAAGVCLPLELPPYGSMFVVFRTHSEPAAAPLTIEGPASASGLLRPQIQWDGRHASVTAFQPGQYHLATSDGKRADLNVAQLSKPLVLTGPWEVVFDSQRGGPGALRLAELIPWNEHPDPAVRYWSGIARYRRPFQLPRDWLGPGRRVMLDLGSLWAVGRVYLNGHCLGILWKPPYAVDVTHAVVAGRNELVVEVANTWCNRLVGEARGEVSPLVMRTNVTSSGGRPWKEIAPRKSGLLGPVRLLPGRTLIVQLAQGPAARPK